MRYAKSPLGVSHLKTFTLRTACQALNDRLPHEQMGRTSAPWGLRVGRSVSRDPARKRSQVRPAFHPNLHLLSRTSIEDSLPAKAFEKTILTAKKRMLLFVANTNLHVPSPLSTGSAKEQRGQGCSSG
eukprot:1150999-Pelagomonas_calceolata.AAC.3